MNRAGFLCLPLLGTLALAGGQGRVLIEPRPLEKLAGHAFDLQWTGEVLALSRLMRDAAWYELKAGTDAVTKQVAQTVIQKQHHNISQLTGWQTRWNVNYALFGDVDSDMPLPGQVDRWFLKQMVDYQARLFRLAQLAPSRSQNRELLKLAGQMRAEHVLQMTRFRTLAGELP